jgi:hypothetical protein
VQPPKDKHHFFVTTTEAHLDSDCKGISGGQCLSDLLVETAPLWIELVNKAVYCSLIPATSSAEAD